MTTTDLFREAMSLVASAVYVVTGEDEMGRPRGFTATSVFPHTTVPASLVVSIDRGAFSHDVLVNGGAFRPLPPRPRSVADGPALRLQAQRQVRAGRLGRG